MASYWTTLTVLTLISLVQSTIIITISGNTTNDNGTTSNTITFGLGTLLAALSSQKQSALNASLVLAANGSQIIQEAVSNITSAKISLINSTLQTGIATGGTIFNTGLRLAALTPRIFFGFGR